MVTKQELDKIIMVKSSSWPYSYKSQINWIKNNIKDNDLHLLIEKEGIALAYLNLVSIDITIDDKKCKGYGIGNVCTINKGQGMGKTLMLSVNEFLRKKNKIGLLFCKKQLINFYSHSGWELIDENKLNYFSKHRGFKTMIYNHKQFDKIYLNINLF